MTFFYIKLHAEGFLFYIIIVFVVYTLKSIHDNVGWRELIKDVIPMEGRFEVRALIFSFRELRKVKVSQKPNILRDWNRLVITKTN
jgi:hypothetical protein